MSEQTFCLIDQKPISHARAVRKSVTCSVACAQALAKLRRSIIDARRCRQCNAPSTPEERKLYSQWRRETGLFGKSGRPKISAAKPPEEQL